MNQNNSFATSTKLLFLIVTSILVFIICINPPVDPDMWWHLKSGQIMWQEKTILTQDIFSFTRFGNPWVNAFWISDLFLYFLYVLGGLPLLIIVISSISTIMFFLMFSRSKGPFFIRSFIILLAAISISPEWTARPQVFSFFLLFLLNLWLEKRKEGKAGPLFLLPFLFIVWVNIHGGFIWGFLLIIATIIGLLLDIFTHHTLNKERDLSEIKQLSMWTFISVFAILINPNGLAIWRLPFYTINVSITVIQEWLSPNFHNLEMQPFLWMVFLLIIGYSLSEKRQSFKDILKAVGFMYLAFVSQRNIPLVVIVITPTIIELFTDFWSRIRTRTISTTENDQRRKINSQYSRILNSIIIILLIILAILRVNLQLSPTLVDEKYPGKAIQSILATSPAGNMFNSYNWGGYLIWNLPKYPVFIDGRADLYGEDIIDEWWGVVNGTDKAMLILDKYNINFIILEPDWPVINILKTNHWNITYQDDISIVMTRK
jgi:hypothetical protein